MERVGCPDSAGLEGLAKVATDVRGSYEAQGVVSWMTKRSDEPHLPVSMR